LAGFCVSRRKWVSLEGTLLKLMKRRGEEIKTDRTIYEGGGKRVVEVIFCVGGGDLLNFIEYTDNECYQKPLKR